MSFDSFFQRLQRDAISKNRTHFVYIYLDHLNSIDNELRSMHNHVRLESFYKEVFKFFYDIFSKCQSNVNITECNNIYKDLFENFLRFNNGEPDFVFKKPIYNEYNNNDVALRILNLKNNYDFIKEYVYMLYMQEELRKYNEEHPDEHLENIFVKPLHFFMSNPNNQDLEVILVMEKMDSTLDQLERIDEEWFNKLLKVINICKKLNIIHLDFKPANIGIKDNEIKLIDLGICFIPFDGNDKIYTLASPNYYLNATSTPRIDFPITLITYRQIHLSHYFPLDKFLKEKNLADDEKDCLQAYSDARVEKAVEKYGNRDNIPYIRSITINHFLDLIRKIHIKDIENVLRSYYFHPDTFQTIINAIFEKQLQ